MKLLDLFRKAGGASMGYYRAGFTEIVGIDIQPQPRYPFRFIQADAMHPPLDLRMFDLIHASPPCQKYSAATKHLAKESPLLIEDVREMLLASGVDFVIENTPGAPLLNPITLCGLAFGLKVKRHRLFESSHFLLAPPCPSHDGDYFVIFGHEVRSRRHGHAAGRKNNLAAGRAAMGIEWMTRGELSEAIPPAYTEWIGKRIMEHIASPSPA